MISISRPQIGEEEKAAVMKVLESGQLAQGPRVQEFEEKFAAWTETKYAVATSSGTTALHVALLAHGIGEGDEVITTAFSFIASANCILYANARPVFADIEAQYYMIDPNDIEKRITPKTKAIIPVHLFGQMSDMEPIYAIAKKHNLAIVEDACQSHGAKLNGKSVGAWGTACYSFYPTKNMTTIEGGMITTNDPAIAERARLIRNHGSPKRYLHEMLGFNFRMTDLQAAIGLAQLAKVEGWNQKRKANAAFMTSHLKKVAGITPPAVRPGSEHVFHQYTIRAKNRDRALEQLGQKGIGVGVYYPIPIHMQPLYKKLGYEVSLPVTEQAALDVLSLPVHPALNQAELDEIVKVVASLELG
jgi:dTDP-4-amino-4,6-dideoxygalactose transaminase